MSLFTAKEDLQIKQAIGYRGVVIELIELGASNFRVIR